MTGLSNQDHYAADWTPEVVEEDRPHSRSRAARVGLLVAVVVAVVVLTGLAFWIRLERETEQAFVLPSASGVSSTLPIGEQATFGIPVLKPTGEGTVTLLSVRPENLSGPLEYLGSVVAGPDRRYGGVTVGQGFPTTEFELGEMQDAEGATLVIDQAAKERGWEVLVGYRMTGTGIGTHDALQIEYEVDGRRYSLRYPHSLTVCSGERGDDCASIDPDE